METGALILPDNTVIDPSQPPPNLEFPKPDFTEIVQDHGDKSDGPVLKPTFKSALQAKKRLQAFSSARSGSLPASPKKVKPAGEEKTEETATTPKKTTKRGNYHEDKAKAVVEEIEELKREEQAYLEQQRQALKRSRSRSRSPDRGRFKKVEKKSRNYRRRSPTPEKPRKSPKKVRKYPRNWREFNEFDANFELNREFEVATPAGNNELLRQVIFESPSLPIVPFKMKTVNREEKNVPFEYIRFTRTKPSLSYSANFDAIKESFLTRKMVLDTLPKEIVANIENLYSNSLKFQPDDVESKAKKSKSWYSKNWKDPENECKIFEKSVGLSFLQSYTGEEEDNDAEEEKKDETKREETKKKKKSEEHSESFEEKKKGEEHSEGVEKKRKGEDRSEDVNKKKKSEDHSDVVEKKKKSEEHSEDVEKKKKTDEHSEGVEKKKKGEEHSEDVNKKKKKKSAGKEKKKCAEGDATETASKKKKQKKDKSKKKAKRTKDKKHKHKKSKEKKKKEKAAPKEDGEKSERPSKQQVIEELKEIEDKIAKKKEETKEKDAKEEKAGRKRKHSEPEPEPRKPEKPNKTNDEQQDEHPLKKKLEKAKKHESEVKEAKKEHKSNSKQDEDHANRQEQKKSYHSDEVVKDHHRRKSRWSDPIPREEIDLENLRIIEEIKNEIKKEEEEKRKIIEGAKETTPDTDEYHSHWESDDEISSSVPVKQSLKINRSWESDEELFERSHNRNKIPPEYTNLEIPLNIKNFSRRSNWDEKPLSVVDELKLLEEERRSISEERRKLEMEKQRILQLQEEAKYENLEEKEAENGETKEETKRPRSSTPEAKVKKEKIDDFSIDSLNNSLLSTVSSTESNFPIAVLENEYEEFIKAVSSEGPVKKKPERSSSSSSSATSWSTDSEQKKKKRKLKKKKKKKKKLRECEGLLLGKGNNIFNEFDIPVPSDLPEMVPTPVPVPSPILPVITPPNLLLNSIIDVQEKPAIVVEEPIPEIVLNLTKPFVFSSIILPSKKTPLVDNSSLHLGDSDSADFTDKFVKKPEEKETETKVVVEEEEEKEPETETTKIEEKKENVIEEEVTKIEPPAFTKIEIIDEKVEVEVNPKPIDDIANVPLPPEKPAPKAPPPPIKRSRSISPRLRRRSRSRSRERRSPIRRREPTPSSRRRYSPLPRRRTPPRRRSSPRRRSPSPRRRSSPLRRRRRSPSLSPPRSRGGARKRSSSPRLRRTSPLNSPLDGFKRSVADSTISDDMLPQPNPDDYNESPPSYGNGAKYYDRKGAKDSPQLSPKRISLDDRISLVLGLEKNEGPPPPPKHIETYPNYNYGNQFGQQQQYTQYGQYVAPKNDYVPPFGPMIYSQPPPPIVKPAPTPTKVVQVGNILQVVPTEEMPPPVIENKVSSQPPERCQKIVQVGNMLQIVPAIMASTKPLPPAPEPPQPVSKPVQIPEKQSAETVMKQKIAERKAERDKRRQERERRRKEKEKKRKEKEKRKQMKLKIKTENMIKRAIQLETEALANDEAEEEGDNSEPPVQWPPVPVIVSTTPSCKGILLQGASGKRKSVQFADGVRPGEGTSPSAGEELSSPPPNPRKLPKEKRYKKVKIPKKSKKKKVRVKVVKKVQAEEEEEDDDELDNLPPPSPPPGSPPPHVFPSRVKAHTINNVHQYVGNILQSSPAGFPFRSPMAQMPVVINRHQPPPGYMQGAFPQGFSDVNSLSHPHPQYQGVASHH